VKPDFIQALSVFALASFFTPLFIVIMKKLWNDPFFMIFATYWAIGGVVSATDFLSFIPKETKQTIGAVYNMLDIPIILTILYYTTTSLQVRKFTGAAFIFFVVLDISGIIIKGVNYDALKYTLGTGIALVLIVVIWEIVRYLQKVEHNNRQNAKVFIYAALLFEYATFILIYIFDYFVNEPHHNDIYFIYYISTLVAILIASCGYLLFKKYKREKPVKNEIKIDIL
jgi:hypothetical protein